MNIFPISPRLLDQSNDLVSDNETKLRDLSLVGQRQVTPFPQESPVTAVVQQVFEDLNTPFYVGEQVIDRTDKEGYFLRYQFPNMSLGDYMFNTKGLYKSICVSLVAYDKRIGCYASVTLKKSREQAENEYEELLLNSNYQRRALHIDIKTSWESVFIKNVSPHAYLKQIRKVKEEQRKLLDAVVSTWKQADLFADVFYADVNYRIRELDHLPEHAICVDQIIFRYKQLPPLYHISNRKQAPILTKVRPPASVTQREGSWEYEKANPSLCRRIWNSVSAISIFNRNRTQLISVERPLAQNIVEIAEEPSVDKGGSLDVPSVKDDEEKKKDRLPRRLTKNFISRLWEGIKSFFSSVTRYGRSFFFSRD